MRLRVLAALLVIITAAACGDSDGSKSHADSTAPAVEPTTSAAPADPTTTLAAESTPVDASTETSQVAESPAEPVAFSVCFQGSRDIGLLTMLEAIEQMEADGHDIETPFLAETELCIDGLTRDDFQVGTLFPASLAAVQAGADNIPMVAVRSLNANLIVAQSGLTTCDDLDGRSFAIHSTGSFMAALFRLWRDRECSPDTEISEIVIPGSGSRTQALIAGEVDSTGVELQDEATLTLNYGGQYEVLERFAETEPQIVAFGVNVNRDFLEEQPDAVRALIRHMTLAARTWAADPAAFAEAIDRHLPDLDPAVASFYVEELGAGTFFPLNGNVTEDALAYTIQLFQDAGVISEPIPVEAVADLGPLRDVLGELGVELELQNAASS